MYEVNYKLKHGLNNSYNDPASVNLVEKIAPNIYQFHIDTNFISHCLNVWHIQFAHA